MATEAAKRAKKRYTRKMLDSGRMKRILLEFYPRDSELYEWAQSHKPMATYIKELIRKDMNERAD